MSLKLTQPNNGFQYESVFLTLFMFFFCGYVLYSTYSENDYRNKVLKESTYKFSEYQLKNGTYITYVDDDGNFAHIVLNLSSGQTNKILVVKDEFLQDPSGPLSIASRSFSAQQQHYLEQIKKAATIPKEITKKNAIIKIDSSLPTLKSKK